MRHFTFKKINYLPIEPQSLLKRIPIKIVRWYVQKLHVFSREIKQRYTKIFSREIKYSSIDIFSRKTKYRFINIFSQDITYIFQIISIYFLQISKVVSFSLFYVQKLHIFSREIKYRYIDIFSREIKYRYIDIFSQEIKHGCIDIFSRQIKYKCINIFSQEKKYIFKII